MDHYELISGVYRIQAGVGTDGEIFGGIFLNDNPGVLIGASGGKTFSKNFSILLEDLGFRNNIRVYFPTVGYHEIQTIYSLTRRLDDITYYVHKDVHKAILEPEGNFFEGKFLQKNTKADRYINELPKSLDNILAIDKSSSFETETTKILIIPFPGPHKGHTFIYSRNHKILFTGLVLGRTSTPQSYYIDTTGSFYNYENALSFLEKAKSEILCPVYDEPEFTKNLSLKVQAVRDAIKHDRENILKLNSLQWKSFDDIFSEYETYYGEYNKTPPFDGFNLTATKVKKHLDWLVKNDKLLFNNGQYRMK